MKYLFIILFLTACTRYIPTVKTTGHDTYEFVEAYRTDPGVYTVWLRNDKYLLTVYKYHTYIVREPKWHSHYFWNGYTLKPL